MYSLKHERTEKSKLFGSVKVELHGARGAVAGIQKDAESLHDGHSARAYR